MIKRDRYGEEEFNQVPFLEEERRKTISPSSKTETQCNCPTLMIEYPIIENLSGSRPPTPLKVFSHSFLQNVQKSPLQTAKRKAASSINPKKIDGSKRMLTRIHDDHQALNRGFMNKSKLSMMSFIECRMVFSEREN